MEWAGSPQYPADVALHDRYAKLGIPHVTALDSIVYHFFRGELREGGYVHK
jgi:GT2 family glycosyltransferase